MLRLWNNGSQKNRFFGCQLRRSLFKIIGCCFLHPINERSPFYYIQIYFLHSFFGGKAFCFYQPDNQSFFQFTGYVFVSIQKYVFHQLHGDGTPSAGKTFHFQILYQRFAHGFRKESPVEVESSVFTLHHRHLQQRRDAVQWCEMFPGRADWKSTYRLAVFVSRIDKFFRHFTKICDPVVYNAEIPFLQFRFQFQTVQQGKICI